MQRSTNETGLATEDTALEILAAVTASGGSPLTASSPTFATIGTSSSIALAGNSSRKGLIIINTSQNIVSLGIASTAVLYSGITLTPRGCWVMDKFNYTTGQINAIASVASSNISIQEFV